MMPDNCNHSAFAWRIIDAQPISTLAMDHRTVASVKETSDLFISVDTWYSMTVGADAHVSTKLLLHEIIATPLRIFIGEFPLILIPHAQFYGDFEVSTTQSISITQQIQGQAIITLVWNPF